MARWHPPAKQRNLNSTPAPAQLHQQEQERKQHPQAWERSAGAAGAAAAAAASSSEQQRAAAGSSSEQQQRAAAAAAAAASSSSSSSSLAAARSPRTQEQSKLSPTADSEVSLRRFHRRPSGRVSAEDLGRRHRTRPATTERQSGQPQFRRWRVDRQCSCSSCGRDDDSQLSSRTTQHTSEICLTSQTVHPIRQ
jgi:hypothetical protein